MTELRTLAQPAIDAAARLTPTIDELRAAVRRRRRRSRVLGAGFGVAALLGGGVLASVVLDNPPEDVRSLSFEDDASVPGDRLPVVGTEVVVASGSMSGETWELVAYQTTPTADGHDRVCSEFRARRRGPQSCFPVDAERGSGWAFLEVVNGVSVFVAATTTDTGITVDGDPLSGFRSDVLPVRFGATAIVTGSHTVEQGTSSYEVLPIVGPGYQPGDGTREPRSMPALEGVFWERLTSHNPAADGWVPVVGNELDGVGYLNPTDTLDDHGLPGPAPDRDPAPVYDAGGRRIGWWTCSFSLSRRSTCGSVTTAGR